MSLLAAAAAGTVTAAAAALCYWRLGRARSVARRLQEAPRFPLDQDLKSVLLNSPGKCLPFAVVEGLVTPVDETLNSQFVDGCKGVIHRLVLKEHNAVWNRTTHLWNDCEKIIHQRINTVPFDLVLADATPNTSVRVMKALESSELDLETVYQKFHPAEQSLPNIVVHYISGERPKGITEMEQMLRTGHAVTGVGELVLDNNLIRLQPSRQGLQYCLCRLDFKSLVQRHESKVRQWKILTLLFGVATCAAICFVLWRRYQRRRLEQEQTRQQEEMMAMKKQRMQELNLKEDEVSNNACAICLIRDWNCVFLPCGHICSCDDCFEALPIPKTCPLCRHLVSKIVLLYTS